jgi:hypothetical protein
MFTNQVSMHPTKSNNFALILTMKSQLLTMKKSICSEQFPSEMMMMEMMSAEEYSYYLAHGELEEELIGNA